MLPASNKEKTHKLVEKWKIKKIRRKHAESQRTPFDLDKRSERIIVRLARVWEQPATSILPNNMQTEISKTGGAFEWLIVSDTSFFRWMEQLGLITSRGYRNQRNKCQARVLSWSSPDVI